MSMVSDQLEMSIVTMDQSEASIYLMERGASGELSNLVHAGLETRNFAFAFMDIE